MSQSGLAVSTNHIVADMSSSASAALSPAELQSLHTKMCKKISQLTKVIYLLHTKNDEYEYDVANVQAQHNETLRRLQQHYETQIQQVHTQLNTQHTHTVAQLSSDHADHIEQLKAQCQRDLLTYETRLGEVSIQHRQQVDAIKQTNEATMESLSLQIEQNNTKTLSRIQSLQQTITSLTTQYEEAHLNKQKLHQEEIKEVVTKSNETWLKQLKQTINDHEINLNKIKSEYEIKYNNDINLNNQTLNNQLNNKIIEYEEKLNSTLNNNKILEKKYLETQQETLKQSQEILQLKQNIEQLNKNLQQKQKMYLESIEEKNEIQEQMNKEIIKLNKNIKLYQDEQHVSSMEQTIQIEQLQQQVQQQNLNIKENNDRIIILQQDKKMLQQEVFEYKQHITKLNINISDTDQQHKTELSVLQTKLDDVNNAMITTTTASSQSLRATNDEIRRLQLSLNECQSRLKQSITQQTINDERYDKQKQEAQRQYNISIIELKNNSIKEMNELNQKLELLQEKYNKEQNEWKLQLITLQTEYNQQCQVYEENLNTSKHDYTITLQETTERHTTELVEVTKNVTQQLIQEYKLKITELQQKTDNELIIQKQIYSDELNKIHTNNDININRLESLYNNRIDTLKQEYNKQIEEYNIEIKKLNIIIENLKNNQLLSENDFVQKNNLYTNQLEILRNKSNNDIHLLNIQIKNEQNLYLNNINILKEENKKNIENLQLEHNNIIEKLNKVHQDELLQNKLLLTNKENNYTENIKNLTENYEQKISDINELNKITTINQINEHEKKINNINEINKEELNKNLLNIIELKKKHSISENEWSNERVLLHEKYNNELENIKNIYNNNNKIELEKFLQEKSILNKVIQEHVENITNLKNLYSSEKNLSSEYKNNLNHKNNEYENYKLQIINERLLEKRSYEDLSRQELSRLMKNHSLEIIEINNKNNLKIEEKLNEINILKENIKNQENIILHWRYRFERREPRKEDVIKIRQLEEIINEEIEKRKKAENDRKLYLLELQNREENYNKMFGRTPVIDHHHHNNINHHNLSSSMNSTATNSPLNSAKSSRRQSLITGVEQIQLLEEKSAMETLSRNGSYRSTPRTLSHSNTPPIDSTQLKTTRRSTTNMTRSSLS